VQTLQLSRPSRVIAGVLLLTIVTIEFGGYYLTTIVRGQVELTDFQQAFARAGHAHAGVLVILSLVAVIMADAAGLHGRLGWIARIAIPVAAVLMSSGFFLSSLGNGRDEPNGLIIMLWIGALSLAIGAITLGIGLLRSALTRHPVSETAGATAPPG
jgi:Ni,Fe-hydrogenase I cytochrome b subunit